MNENKPSAKQEYAEQYARNLVAAILRYGKTFSEEYPQFHGQDYLSAMQVVLNYATVNNDKALHDAANDVMQEWIDE